MFLFAKVDYARVNMLVYANLQGTEGASQLS